ncbi:MAG: hypothetical protein KJO43_05940 [Phycisphaerae bacterium]|nr:hypothetical protein [Phycisphaerae bacterium]
MRSRRLIGSIGRPGHEHRAMIALMLAAIATAVWPAAGADAFDAAVRHLRRTATPQRDGTHLARLFALRQLDDPSLRVFYRRLLSSADWQTQVHAALGLAELSADGQVDPGIIAGLQERAAEAVISSGLDMERLGPAVVRILLERHDLAPLPRTLLLCELLLAGEPVAAEDVTTLIDQGSPSVSALATLLLAQLGDAAALSSFTHQLARLASRDRTRDTQWLLEAIRQYKLHAALPWVQSLVSRPETDRETAYWALLTLLEIAPQRGLEQWRRIVPPAASYRDQVRYGMLLLAAETGIPAAAYDRLTDESPLVRGMVAAGQSLARGEDASGPLIALLDLGLARTTAWAMRRLESLPADQAAPVYRHLIDTVGGDQPGRAEHIAHAVTATARLFRIEPDAVLERLLAAADDSLEQEVLLLGLFDADSPRAGEAARRLRRIGAGRADSLALLLIARHATMLSDGDRVRLGRIVGGGGRVSEGLQTQAAWLYLRHTDGVTRALETIFTPPLSGAASESNP